MEKKPVLSGAMRRLKNCEAILYVAACLLVKIDKFFGETPPAAFGDDLKMLISGLRKEGILE